MVFAQCFNALSMFHVFVKYFDNDWLSTLCRDLLLSVSSIQGFSALTEQGASAGPWGLSKIEIFSKVSNYRDVSEIWTHALGYAKKTQSISGSLVCGI